jgi:hypothetical protein
MVSSVVPTTDDPSIPSFTFRVLVLGTLWNVFLAAANSIFAFRTNPISIPTSVANILSYPMALVMASYLPSKIFSLCGFKFSLNPGAFSIKEVLFSN